MSFQKKVFRRLCLISRLTEASVGFSRLSALASIKYLELELYLQSIALLKKSKTRQSTSFTQKTPLCVREIFISHNVFRPQESSQISVFFTLRARDVSDLVCPSIKS